MKNKLGKLFLLTIILVMSFCQSAVYAGQSLPKLFLFIGSTKNLDLRQYQTILTNPYVSGVQVVYTWAELEPTKDHYDFSRITKDLDYLHSIHKDLFIQLQDRSFEPTAFYVPNYIRSEPIYHGGVAMQADFPGEGKPITEGWVARVWDPAVSQRFQLLMQQLATHFDGKIYGINLPETAVDFNAKQPPEGFTTDKYFQAELANVAFLRNSFHQSKVVQYVNFFPGEWQNDHNYMGRLFLYASQHDIGIGGPDVVPYRKGQMKNSYPFFHQYQTKLAEIAMAVQEPDYTYKNPITKNHYTFADLYSFAKNYLGASIIFWNTQEPFFSEQLKPALNNAHFALA